MKSESQGPVHGGPLRLWQDFGLYSKYNGKRWEGSELGWEGSSEAVRSGHICFDVQTSTCLDWLEPTPFSLLNILNFTPAFKKEKAVFANRWVMLG